MLGEVAGLFLFGAAKVDLWDFVARDRAGVLDVEAHFEVAVRLRGGFEVRVGEGGIAQAEAKGEERVDFLFIEPAVADVDAL